MTKAERALLDKYKKLAEEKEKKRTCPTCGHCPTCGQHRWPYWTTPYYPYWVTTTTTDDFKITWTSDVTTGSVNVPSMTYEVS